VKANMQRMLGKSMKLGHTFKVDSRLSPDTFWICFRAGESLKESDSDSPGFAMTKMKMTKLT
jgi:hypothetical protein